MKNLFPEGTSPRDRIHNLEAMAYSIEEGTYLKHLSSEELETKREQLTDNVIKAADLDEKKKAYVDSIKAELKPLSIERRSLMAVLKTKHEEVEGKIYHIDDQEEGVMNSFNENGEFINSRRLRPEERQTTIFSINKAQ